MRGYGAVSVFFVGFPVDVILFERLESESLSFFFFFFWESESYLEAHILLGIKWWWNLVIHQREHWL